MFMCISAYTALEVAIVATTFGTRHGTMVYFFVSSSHVIASVIGTLSMQVVTDHFGWFWSWLTVGLVTFANLLVTLVWFE